MLFEGGEPATINHLGVEVFEDRDVHAATDRLKSAGLAELVEDENLRISIAFEIEDYEAVEARRAYEAALNVAPEMESARAGLWRLSGGHSVEDEKPTLVDRLRKLPFRHAWWKELCCPYLCHDVTSNSEY